MSTEEIRIKNAIKVREVFKEIGVQVKGTENLPYERGSIFIYNHLNNHPDLIVGDQFQITLDSHFISSILHTYYGNPGIRVTRHALPNEKSHQIYYDLLGYIRVFSEPFIPKGITKKTIKKENKNFFKIATRELQNENSLVCSPEGISHQTLNSPGPFKKGVFALASSMSPQPKIVPIVLANFDLLPKDIEYKCKIMDPFRMSDYGIFDPKDPMIDEVVKTINLRYQKWVNELSVVDQNFEQEITVLQRRAAQKTQQNDLIVFYGSSSIRLWDLKQDFPSLNTLNLGFGGAFIHSLSNNFENLFQRLQPKAIVLYLGGNDLTLGLSASEIVEQIQVFVQRIHIKFPSTTIFNVSLKPSFERQELLEVIQQINQGMLELSMQFYYLHQVKLYEALIDQNQQIRSDVLLQDGLHLNEQGYQILKAQIDKALKNHLL
ncbi:GDSL-type esterase/lipase family protein [Flavobacteriaceae bacterium]|nr:GDSL-type esterase/lipase family protein [Flavobacteriaceae bacterium]